jgi:hypothetical protein
MKQNHVKLFEDFFNNSELEGIKASDLSSKEYWAEFDDNDGETATEWEDDPGYNILSDMLDSPLENIQALNSEENDLSELEEKIEGMTPLKTIQSTQDYIGSWEYYPEVGVAVAYGNGGAPDYWFYKGSN